MKAESKINDAQHTNSEQENITYDDFTLLTWN